MAALAHEITPRDTISLSTCYGKLENSNKQGIIIQQYYTMKIRRNNDSTYHHKTCADQTLTSNTITVYSVIKNYKEITKNSSFDKHMNGQTPCKQVVGLITCVATRPQHHPPPRKAVLQALNMMHRITSQHGIPPTFPYTSQNNIFLLLMLTNRIGKCLCSMCVLLNLTTE